LDFAKISSQIKKIKKNLGLSEGTEESCDNTPVILKIVEKGGLNGGHNSFYISFQVNNLLLYNILLDFGASNNIIPLTTIQKLVFKVIRLCQNICAMDRREV
jgi:hypothetical protein